MIYQRVSTFRKSFSSSSPVVVKGGVAVCVHGIVQHCVGDMVYVPLLRVIARFPSQGSREHTCEGNTGNVMVCTSGLIPFTDHWRWSLHGVSKVSKSLRFRRFWSRSVGDHRRDILCVLSEVRTVTVCQSAAPRPVFTRGAALPSLCPSHPRSLP